MIRCDNCGTNNIDGSDYCDECGMKLQLMTPQPVRREPVPVYQPPSAVESEPMSFNMVDSPVPAPPSFTTSTSVPKPATPARDRKSSSDSRTSSSNARRSQTNERSGPAFKSPVVGSPAVSSPAVGSKDEHAMRSAPPSTFALSASQKTGDLDSDEPKSRALARLIIERGGRIGKEFPITGIEANIGRWDADSGIFPDVDLDEDDAEAKVSRRHARIVNHNSQFFIEDLGSTNGTFVNRGRRLLPGKRHMLQNGDEIIVGKTFLKFQILK